MLKAITAALLFAGAPPQIVPVPQPEAPKVLELKASTGEQVQLKADKPSRWFLITQGAQLRTPGNIAESDIATFTSIKPGVYLVLAVNADGASLAQLAIGMGPDPIPVDELAKKLAAAFLKDSGTKEQAHAMAALYKQAAIIAKDAKQVAGTKQLRDKVRDASIRMLADFPEGTLEQMRTVVAEELIGVLGELSDAPMADSRRAAAVDFFSHLASILEVY